MLEPILTDEQRELLESERTLLAETRTALERNEAADDDLRALSDSVAQLDELFLLVVVGEFNAGKSALINALLGSEVLAEGVPGKPMPKFAFSDAESGAVVDFLIWLDKHGERYRSEFEVTRGGGAWSLGNVPWFEYE